MILGIDTFSLIFFLCLGVLLLATLVPVSVAWEAAVGAFYRDVRPSRLGFAAAEATLVVLVYWILLVSFLPSPLPIFSDLGMKPLIVFALKLSAQVVSMLCNGEGSLPPTANGWPRFALNAGAPSIALLFWSLVRSGAFG
jgi:hypothetical protein